MLANFVFMVLNPKTAYQVFIELLKDAPSDQFIFFKCAGSQKLCLAVKDKALAVEARFRFGDEDVEVLTRRPLSILGFFKNPATTVEFLV